jgi:hypothetical protein
MFYQNDHALGYTNIRIFGTDPNGSQMSRCGEEQNYKIGIKPKSWLPNWCWNLVLQLPSLGCDLGIGQIIHSRIKRMGKKQPNSSCAGPSVPTHDLTHIPKT